MLVTPWFAAGAGFVIAAALALNSPHTMLTYGPNARPCDGCKQAAPQRGSPANATPGVRIKTAKPVGRRRVTQKASQGKPAGPAVGYRVVWNRNGEFGAIFTIPAAAAGAGWNLRFGLPGTRIVQVVDAGWQPGPGADGGLASMPAPRPVTSAPAGQASAPPGQGGSGRGGSGRGGSGRGGSGRGGGHRGYGHPGPGPSAPGDSGRPWPGTDVRFLVIAQGRPASPVSCVLDGTTCHFG